jgi:hypothetical protein
MKNRNVQRGYFVRDDSFPNLNPPAPNMTICAFDLGQSQECIHGLHTARIKIRFNDGVASLVANHLIYSLRLTILQLELIRPSSQAQLILDPYVIHYIGNFDDDGHVSHLEHTARPDRAVELSEHLKVEGIYIIHVAVSHTPVTTILHLSTIHLQLFALKILQCHPTSF